MLAAHEKIPSFEGPLNILTAPAPIQADDDSASSSSPRQRASKRQAVGMDQRLSQKTELVSGHGSLTRVKTVVHQIIDPL